MESIFFQYFFFSFLISIFISILIVILILGFFTNNFGDKTSIQDIINLEKKTAESELKTANIRVTTFLSEYQTSFDELILFYQNISNDLLIDENSYQLQNNYIRSIALVRVVDCFNYRLIPDRKALWILDELTTQYNIGSSNKFAEKQLIALSNLIANLDTILQISTPEAHSYYFYFEETGLYLTFPLLEQCYNNKYNYLRNYPIMELDKCKYEDEKMHDHINQYMKSILKIWGNLNLEPLIIIISQTKIRLYILIIFFLMSFQKLLSNLLCVLNLKILLQKEKDMHVLIQHMMI